MGHLESSSNQSIHDIAGSLAKGMAKYAVGGTAARGLALISLPVYMRFLTPHDFGVQALALLNENILILLAGFVVTNAVSKYYVETSPNRQLQEQVVGSAFLFMLTISIILFIIVQLAANPICRWTMEYSKSNVWVIRILGFSFIANMFSAFVQMLWQMGQQIRLYFINAMLRQILSFVFGLLFVSWFHWGIIGLMGGWLISSLAVAIWSLHWFFRHFKLTFHGPSLKKLLEYGFPLLPAALITLALNGFDRYWLKSKIGLDAVGIYAIAVSIASSANLVLITPFKQIWAPFMWRMRRRQDEKDLHRHVFTYYMTGQMYALCVCTASIGLAMKLVAHDRPVYLQSTYLIPVLFAGMIFFGAYDMLSSGYYFEDKTHYYTMTVVISTICNVLLNIVLIPLYSQWGAAWSYLFAYIVFAVLSLVYARPFFEVPYEWGRIVKMIALMIMVLIVAVSIHLIGGLIAGVCSIVVMIGVPPVLVWRYIFTSEEQHWLSMKLRQWIPGIELI